MPVKVGKTVRDVDVIDGEMIDGSVIDVVPSVRLCRRGPTWRLSGLVDVELGAELMRGRGRLDGHGPVI